MTARTVSYAKLLTEIEPRPITSKAALTKTYILIDKLMSKPTLSRAESEMLELLSMLVEQYEGREHPTPRVTAAEMLEHLIRSRGINYATLAAETKISRSIITEILAGRRRISLGNVRKFAEDFRVSPSAFVSQEAKSAAESEST